MGLPSGLQPDHIEGQAALAELGGEPKNVVLMEIALRPVPHTNPQRGGSAPPPANRLKRCTAWRMPGPAKMYTSAPRASGMSI